MNIGLALKIMAPLHPPTGTGESLVSAGAILGMMAGQILFGAAGDCLGRQRALCYTLIVCFLGAAGSALLTFRNSEGGPDIYQQLLYWRILLGAGAGGVYPLAATLARTSSVDWAWLKPHRDAGDGGEHHSTDTGSTAVALMFSMQGVGYLAAHFTGFVLLSALPERPSLTWRLLLGLGAIPPFGVVLMLAVASARARRYALVRSLRNREPGAAGAEERGALRVTGAGGEAGSVQGAGSSTARVWLALRDKHKLLPKLIGTAGSWFLFDVTFYGNQLVSRSPRLIRHTAEQQYASAFFYDFK